jgi:hypothetical protein
MRHLNDAETILMGWMTCPYFFEKKYADVDVASFEILDFIQ